MTFLFVSPRRPEEKFGGPPGKMLNVCGTVSETGKIDVFLITRLQRDTVTSSASIRYE